MQRKQITTGKSNVRRQAVNDAQGFTNTPSGVLLKLIRAGFAQRKPRFFVAWFIWTQNLPLINFQNVCLASISARSAFCPLHK